jgi:hypothetical protein
MVFMDKASKSSSDRIGWESMAKNFKNKLPPAFLLDELNDFSKEDV